VSPSPFFDRQRVEQARTVLPPIDALERVPIPRDAVPKRVVSHELDVDLIDGPADDVMREVWAKVKAEDERLRRILPAPPYGKKWLGEIQALDAHGHDFARGADLAMRVVYRLVDE
jgi:hypothetical protein